MARPSTESIYHDLCHQLGIDHTPVPAIQGQDPACPSVHRVGDAMAAALSTLATTLCSLWRLRTGQSETFSISIDACIAQLMAIFFTTTNGVSCMGLMEDPKLLGTNDFYQAKKGRWVFLLTTYPHLRDIACEALDCRCEKTKLAEQVAKWDAFELEDLVSSKGGCCIAVRSRDEWQASEVGKDLLDTPIIQISKIDSSDPEPLPVPQTSKPLQGLRVLDNTHVIAGPMTSRMCAEFGAEVLQIAAPAHRDPFGMFVETGIGKRSAWCDLTKPEDAEEFWSTLSEADVYVSSYLSLHGKGFSPEAIANQRPGIIIAEFHAWGSSGPWKDRGGFDQLACSATGFSLAEGDLNGNPSLPPTHLLNDYLAAALGAAAIVSCLQRRAKEGGSWRVEVNLSRICMWVQGLGLFERGEVEGLQRPSVEKMREKVKMESVMGPFGETKYLPTQIQFGGAIKPGLERGAEPWGVSGMEWVGS